jgi:hypothetical protein
MALYTIKSNTENVLLYGVYMYIYLKKRFYLSKKITIIFMNKKCMKSFLTTI